jgi:hypothetical protein
MTINMNKAQLKRKFDIDKYVGKIEELERTIAYEK